MNQKLFYLFVLPVSVLIGSFGIQYFFGSSISVLRSVSSSATLFLFGLYFTRKKGEDKDET